MIPIHHNVVNLIYMIKGCGESHLSRAEEGAFEDESARIRNAEDYLRRIVDQAQKALDTMKYLGKLIRIASDGLRVRSKVSVQFSWEKTLERLKSESKLQQVEILERIPDDFPVLHCQRDEFREIIFQLSKNAIEAMNGKGKLVFRTHRGYRPNGEPVGVISISDTGPGMNQSDLAALFSPFSSSKSEIEGNGLGLYLAKTLTQKNQGTIQAFSYPGMGTSFILEFPCYK